MNSRIAAAGLAGIDDKLRAGERLSFEDGVRLFECPDLLAVGWLANREREKRHGGAHVLQLQPAPRADQRLRGELPVLLVRAAEADRRRRLHDVARTGVGQAAAARHSAADRAAHRQRPQPGSAVQLLHGAAAGIQAHPPRHPPEVLHRRGDRVLRRPVWHERRAGAARADGGGARFAAGRRRGDLRGARAPENLPRQVRRRPVSRHPPASRIGWACAPT